MRASYWQSIVTARYGRRRALTAAGAGAAGALLLAACGGSSSKGTSTSTGLVTATRDETKAAKIGGTLKGAVVSVPGSLDPHLATGGGAGAGFSRLWRIKPGILKNTSGEVEGDLVDSWEVSPDKMTITAKLSPNAHFAPIAPTNGREVDADDVVFSWNRHKSVASARSDYWADVPPGTAPIQSIAAIDKRTLTIKLARPTATVLSLLSRDFAGDFHILPKEPGIDFRQIFPGSGAWYYTKLDASTGMTLQKNPGYKQDKIANTPFIDTLSMPLISENAQQIAQMRAGAIHVYPGRPRPEDLLQMKKDIPAVELTQQVNFASRVERFGFGVAAGSPFLDERLRTAFNLTLDRPTLLEVGGGGDLFKKEGLAWDYRLESGLENGSPGWDGWLLDPRDEKTFGPNAVNYKYDVARAKQLASAAGFPNGMNLNIYTVGNMGNFAFFSVALDSIVDMVRSSGVFNATRRPINDNVQFQLRYQNQVMGDPFDGLAVSLSVNVAGSDPANYLFYYYNQAGSRRQGTDATLTDMTNKAIAEFDTERRKQLVQDIQRYEAKVLYFPRLGAVSDFQIAWPVVRNRGVYIGGLLGANVGWGGVNLTTFLDPSQAPEGKKN